MEHIPVHHFVEILKAHCSDAAHCSDSITLYGIVALMLGGVALSYAVWVAVMCHQARTQKVAPGKMWVAPAV